MPQQLARSTYRSASPRAVVERVDCDRDVVKDYESANMALEANRLPPAFRQVD